MSEEISVRVLKSLSPALLAWTCCFSALVFLGLNVSPAFSQTKKPDQALAAKSLHVVSDKMVALQDSSMVEFIGNVKATHEDSVILADSIQVYFRTTESGQNDQSRVKKIVSTGNVHYTSGERQAFADKMVYTTEDEVLVLTGKSPKLLTGKSWVTGKKITLFRKDDRAVVESDPESRVEAFFDPQDQNQDQKQDKKD